MLRDNLRERRTDFSDLFSLRDDEGRGRTIQLACVLLSTVYNIFVTGLFYTGFLSMYGMSITDAGIVTFIPSLANLFSIFSSRVLARFKRRKAVLLTAKMFFYAMYIVATNIMPQLVTDPGQRLRWFVIIVFLAYAVYAPFNPGLTSWFYHFYPRDNLRRTRYLTWQQALGTVMSSLVLILSSYLTDAVAGSPHQSELILGLRYGAFVLVAVETFLQSRAREYPCLNEAPLRLKTVFTLPFRYRKFIRCMLMMFCWNFIANLPNGVWNYHLLNHLKFSYTLINGMSVTYTVMFLLLSNAWRKVLRRYSWIKTFGIALLLWVPTELLFFTMTPDRTFLFVPLNLVQNVLSVGLNLSYANILYMNLPEENATSHIAFNTFGCSLFSLLGLLTSTFLCSLSGDHTMPFLGMQIYSVQFMCLARAATMLAMGLTLVRRWRAFTSDADIAELESAN